MSDVSRWHVLVRGDVQGVGFRYFIQREARLLGVNGWVTNLPSGEVECVAEGSKSALNLLLEAVRHGPPAARIDEVEERWEDPQGESGGMRIV